MRWWDGIINSMNTTLSKLRERVKEGSLACCSSWGHKESDVTEAEQNMTLASELPLFSITQSCLTRL